MKTYTKSQVNEKGQATASAALPELQEQHAREVARGERFQFGANWAHFLRVLNDDRIAAAEESLRQMLETEHLHDQRFLDAGSGSGLFSLAARRLGAHVYSFDYDPRSVACTAELRRRYYGDDPQWEVKEGSVLDANYLKTLGQFNVVYSWGVLHHTGAMWQALENVAPLIAPGGKLYISIYNDQGGTSRRWAAVKRLYNRVPKPVQIMLVLGFGAFREIRPALGRLARRQNPLSFKDWERDVKGRGMSVWYDLVDWVGGYPFEVAKPEQIFDFYRARGFTLCRLKTKGGGLGCNEMVFEKSAR